LNNIFADFIAGLKKEGTSTTLCRGPLWKMPSIQSLLKQVSVDCEWQSMGSKDLSEDQQAISKSRPEQMPGFLQGGTASIVSARLDFPDVLSPIAAVGFVATEIKVFKLKKTNLDIAVSLIPAISDAGRVHFNTNEVYYIKLINDLSWNVSFYGSWTVALP
jgi:hypothetical protein